MSMVPEIRRWEETRMPVRYRLPRLEDSAASIRNDESAHVGDGGGGGGISLVGTSWDREALAIAEEVSMSFGGDLKIFAFKTSKISIILVRIEKLSTREQSVGDGSTILSSYVGVVARSGLLPLCIDDWRHIDREVKTRVIEHLKARFDLEGDKDLHWTLGKLGERWRNFKHRLYRDYVTGMSRRDTLTNCPPHKKSKENMQSQSHSKAPHNTGRKSIANRAKDLQKNHPQGVVPPRHELWKLIRTQMKDD
ncbi:hypothetical protein QJS10_CPA05g01239 [Acorus calamus]|uniref:Uncharacterized protein n=1 Tax=Acorus calamus TaxID=4465 RepID=A0AAV9EW83_ACOCL|nr:hypothetical protein QJS10_CPA05g01239 [Acorus calamus]